ncbi:MAG: hypothetical protein ACOC2W_01455 [bacterium]
MNLEQYKYVEKVYNEIIKTQLLKPKEIKTAANYILNNKEDALISTLRAKRIIYSFMNNQAKKFLEAFEEVLEDVDDDKSVDKTDTNAPEPEPKPEEQSHSEDDDVHYTGIKEQEDTEDLDAVKQQIKELEQKRENSNDSNEKRSLSMKINYLKKKLN